MGKPKKTIVKGVEETLITKENGEVRESHRKTSYQFESEPNYIKCYSEDLCYWMSLPSGLGNVLGAMLQYLTFAGDTKYEEGGLLIVLNPYVRNQLLKKIGFKSKQSLTNAIGELVKKRILLKVSSNTYRANPNFFGRGDWRDIKRLRVLVDYPEDGVRVITPIVEKEIAETPVEEKRLPIKLSEAETLIYEYYTSLEKIATERNISLSDLQKSLQFQNPPDWFLKL